MHLCDSRIKFQMTGPSPLFAELTSKDIDAISRHGIKRVFKKNSVIITEGDSSDSLYVIKTGKVKVFASDESSKEVILNIQGPGEYFGELSLIDDTPRSASVMTTEDSTLILVTRVMFEKHLIENPELAIKLIRFLAQRIKSLTMNVKNLALLDVYGRVAKTLLDLAVNQNNRLITVERLTHQDIADRVGSSREMVSRIIKDLVDGGYVEVEGKRYIIKSKLPAHY